MAQKRSISGIEFEKKVCEKNGWCRKSASPSLKWSGKGRSIIDRIGCFIDNPKGFLPDLDKSKFDKYDCVDDNGIKREIKDYPLEALQKRWTTYSEPIRCVKSKKELPKIYKVLGNGSYEKSVENYNKVISEVENNVGDDIINRIKSSNIGIQCQNAFIDNSELEFRWKMKKGWMGYNRLTIDFRVKNNK
jgi:hypothetical protein